MVFCILEAYMVPARKARAKNFTPSFEHYSVRFGYKFPRDTNTGISAVGARLPADTLQGGRGNDELPRRAGRRVQ